MIQITPQMRVLVAIEPADFRRGIDGLAGLCRQALGEIPMSGALFVFRDRSGTAVKLLVYDGQGYWCCHMRMSSSALVSSTTMPAAPQLAGLPTISAPLSSTKVVAAPAPAVLAAARGPPPSNC